MIAAAKDRGCHTENTPAAHENRIDVSGKNRLSRHREQRRIEVQRHLTHGVIHRDDWVCGRSVAWRRADYPRTVFRWKLLAVVGDGGVDRPIGNVVVPARVLQPESKGIICAPQRSIAFPKTTSNNQPALVIGDRISQRDLYSIALVCVSAIGEGGAVIGATQSALSGINQAAGFATKNRLGVCQMDFPLNGAIREGKFPVGVVVKVTPEMEHLGLPPHAALIVFVLAIRRSGRWRRERKFRPQKPFRAVTNARNTDGWEYLYLQ